MGVNVQDLAAYINEAIVMRAAPATKSLISGTIAQIGMREKAALLIETASGRRMGFVDEDVTATLTTSVNDIGSEPSIFAKKHRIGFTGATSLNDTIRVGHQTFQFVTTVSVTDASFIPVSLGTGAATVCAANLRTRYNLFPDIAVCASVSPTACSFIATKDPFELRCSLANVSIQATVQVRDGAGTIELHSAVGVPATTGDSYTLTYAATTRADGRVLGSKSLVISVT